MDKSRVHDLKVVEQGLKSSDANIRDQAYKAGVSIKKQAQDKTLLKMRHRLVEETRKGKNDNANDIREDIQNHTRRGYGRSSFTFTIPEGIFKK